jgi:hypothetical protein
MPGWRLVNDARRPGEATFVNSEKGKCLHISRTKAAGCGGPTFLLRENLNLDLGDFEAIFTFDVRPIFSDVRGGTGDNNSEWPASLQVVLVTGEGKEVALIKAYNYRGGTDLNQKDLIILGNGSAKQGEWLRGETLQVKKHFPDATKIKDIYIGGNGWNFESEFDNLVLELRPLGATKPVPPEKPSPPEKGYVLTPGTLEWLVCCYYDFTPQVVGRLHSAGCLVDDVVVILFLAYYAGSEPLTIAKWRVEERLSWREITVDKLKLDNTIYFTTVQEVPKDPPYGRAYGLYKKFWRTPKDIILTDEEIVNLVQLKSTSDAYNLPAHEVIKFQQQGRKIEESIELKDEPERFIKTKKGNKIDVPAKEKPTSPKK